MDRRNLILTGASVLAGTAMAAGAPAAKPGTGAAAKDGELLAALAACASAGDACIAHCMAELEKGNKAMGACNRSVHEMIAVCGAMHDLVAYGSPLAKDLKALCEKACDSCAKTCDEHKAHFEHGMHLACRDCRDACNRVVTALKAA